MTPAIQMTILWLHLHCATGFYIEWGLKSRYGRRTLARRKWRKWRPTVDGEYTPRPSFSRYQPKTFLDASGRFSYLV